MGETVGQLMLEVLEDPDREPRRIVLEAQLVGNASIGRARQGK